MYYVLIGGPAGSGKSTFTSALASWMHDNGLDVAKVNFDPAAEVLPYTPDVDVRRYINARDLMIEKGLGPNGALVASVDYLINYVMDIREEIDETRANYTLIDLPGQLEIVAFRRLGPLLLKELVKGSKAAMAFLLDVRLVTDPPSAFSSALLTLSTLYRVAIPMSVVINKIDLITEMYGPEVPDLKEKVYMLRLLDEDYSCVEAGNSMLFIDTEISQLLCNVFKEALSGEVIPASAKELVGLDTVYGSLQRSLAGGEDFLTEEASEH